MAAKKKKTVEAKAPAPAPAPNPESAEIWKQIIITVGVVIVALIGSWQAIAIVRLNNQPPTPAPSAIPAASTNTPIPPAATNTELAPQPVVAIPATQTTSPTNTAVGKAPVLKPVNIDLSKLYRLTNDSLGKNFSLDHFAATKDLVMNATAFFSGQYWIFKVAGPGTYTLSSEFYGQDILLNVATDNNNSLTLSTGGTDPKSNIWKLSSSGNCVRISNQALGDGWSLDLTTINNVPSPYMAQSADTSSQCWHLTQVGTVK
jgi:hypothetical protein